MFMMPVVGQLVSRVDPRLMIFAGFTATAAALYHMTTINLDIDFRTAAMYRVYQTFGLAFIFIPINTLSYVGIPRNKNNQVSGITNLARNLGGSIGISMLSTFLQRLSQRHQVYLTAHATAGDPVFSERIAGMTQTFISQGLPPDQANARAYSLLNRIILGQASTLAYIDIISIMAVLVLLLAPCAFLMKRPQKGAAPAAAH
jgi:DHA2 family multidrug resistance protein